MEFRVLGPLEVRSNGVVLPIGTPKQRGVLALLAVNAGRVVDLDALIDHLWPHDPPASAAANVRGYAGSLRRLLDSAEPTANRLHRQGSGYVLYADTGQLDLLTFSDHVAAAAEAARQQEKKTAASRLRDGLALWRGPMVAGLPVARDSPSGALRPRTSACRWSRPWPTFNSTWTRPARRWRCCNPTSASTRCASVRT